MLSSTLFFEKILTLLFFKEFKDQFENYSLLLRFETYQFTSYNCSKERALLSVCSDILHTDAGEVLFCLDLCLTDTVEHFDQ